MSHSTPGRPTIYFVSADYPPDNNAGAARVKAYVSGLLERASVIVLSNKHAKTFRSEKLVRIPVGNPQSGSRFIRRALTELLFGFLVYFRLLFIPKGSVIFVTSPPFVFCMLIAFLPRRKTVSLVLDVRDIYPEVYRQAGVISENGTVDRVLSWIEKRAYHRADIVLTVCKSLRDMISGRAGSTPVKIIMNGYGSEFHGRTAETPKTTGNFTIATHGNFGRFQDVDLIGKLVHATRHLPIDYLFIGFGAKFDDLPDAPNVTKKGAVLHTEIPGILENVDLGLSFRTSDEIGRNAIPVKILEYIGASLPSLVVPIMPDLIDLDEANAIRQFEADQLPDIVACLEDLVGTTTTYTDMCDAAQSIRQNYSRSSQVDQAIEAVFEMLDEKKAKSQ